MNGWGRRYLTVNPNGSVLPCPTAWEIPGLAFDNVRERPLAWIWKESESFNRFRGTEWMPGRVDLVHKERLTLAAAVARPHSSPAILPTPIRPANIRLIIGSYSKPSEALRISPRLLICTSGKIPESSRNPMPGGRKQRILFSMRERGSEASRFASSRPPLKRREFGICNHSLHGLKDPCVPGFSPWRSVWGASNRSSSSSS
jgi:Iron-sulfur cluster-binding domain